MLFPDFTEDHPTAPVNAGTKALVAYSLPGKTEKMLITGAFFQLTDNSILNSNKEGFLMAPFTAGYPLLWLEAEKTTCFGNDSSIITDFPIIPPIIPQTQRTGMVTETEYLEQVERITDLLKSGAAEKVVLSRQIHVPMNKEMPVMELFNHLCRLYPEAFTYLAFFPGFGLWLGATPETLLGYQNRILKTVALAGTRPVGENGEWGKKETEEHNFVVDFIHKKLEASGCQSVNLSMPYTIAAGKAEHLCTGFTAMCDRNTIAGTVKALHPTPAVCGWPSEKALEIISNTEKHSRVYYTGYLGPVNKKIIQLFVNLRCMQITDDKAIIYAGGGLTAGSEPKSEWAETELKSTTMLAAIEKMQNLAH